MLVRNTADRFGAITIVLHWIAAVTILTMLFTGLMMFLAPGRDAYLGWVTLHGSVGALLWPVLAARVAWHFYENQPRKLADSPALNRLAKAVHAAVLVLIALQLVTGPLDIWSGGFAINIFDWFALPSPVPGLFKSRHDAIGLFHSLTGLAIGALVALHLSGVAKHVFLDRDGTLGRMLGRSPPGRP